FFSSRRRHTRSKRDWSSDVCSSDLTDTKYWHDYIFDKAGEVRFIKGRLKFGGSKNSAPFPSAIIVYDNKFNKTKYSTCEYKNKTDRKSTRLNSSHVSNSYAVFCFKK